MRRALAVAALAGTLLTTAGCPAGRDRSADPTPPPSTAAPSALPGRPTDASTGLPAYAGPPADAPASAGPVSAVRGAVDLTPGAQAYYSRAEAAVAAPGGAYVVLTRERLQPAQELLTVRTTGDGLALTGSVRIPRIVAVEGMYLLPDGGVLVAGRLPSGDYGFDVLDPATGAARSVPVVPHAAGTTTLLGRSALSSDQRTLYLFVSAERAAGTREVLTAVDVATGRRLAERDLGADVAAVSSTPVGRQLADLVARPGGGVTLVFDAAPTDVAVDRIPTLLPYDGGLTPDGGAVRATSLSERAETQAVAAGVDGTVFLLVKVPDGSWILAVPDRGGAGPVLAQLPDRIFDYALSVEPAQVWALLPAAEGVRPVDLTSGEVRPPVGIGCPAGRDVRTILRAPDGAGVLLLGQCRTPRGWTQMLWSAGP